MMNNRKYPTSLFLIGLITNILFHFFWLLIPGVILLMVGIWIRPCLYIGLVLLVADVVLSLIEQFQIRQAFLTESDNPDFQAFQDALSKSGNRKDHIDEFLNQKRSDPQNETKKDHPGEDS
ncbi:MAG: hypothetical protein IJY42_00395 [Clostridia bacterium]|nr:hypothetical protein [Clostridia bacterium]